MLFFNRENFSLCFFSPFSLCFTNHKQQDIASNVSISWTWNGQVIFLWSLKNLPTTFWVNFAKDLIKNFQFFYFFIPPLCKRELTSCRWLNQLNKLSNYVLGSSIDCLLMKCEGKFQTNTPIENIPHPSNQLIRLIEKLVLKIKRLSHWFSMETMRF